MESRGIDDFGGFQEDAVERVGIESDEGGIDGKGRGGGRSFWCNAILSRIL